MAEVFFILIVFYIAYLINSKTDNHSKPMTEKSSQPAKPAHKKTVQKPSNTAAKQKPKQDFNLMPKGFLRNPESGEKVKLPNSYRMTRKWIKQALVNEGLLDKVYTNKEINEETQRQIHQAIQALLNNKKYQ